MGELESYAEGRTTISPLPSYSRRGLFAVGFFGLLSLIATTSVFFFMTWMILRRGRCPTAVQRQHSTRKPHYEGEGPNRNPDLSLGLEAKHLGRQKVTELSKDPAGDESDTSGGSGCASGSGSGADGNDEREASIFASNPFLVYIYNLVIADIIQSIGYMMCLVWAVRNGVFAPSSTCWSQGWITNIGTVGPGLFLIAISSNAYLTVIWAYRPSPKVLRGVVGFAWILTFLLPTIPVLVTDNGKTRGGWYVRVYSWCQINTKWSYLGFWFTNLWVILAIGWTVILYALMGVSLWRRKQSSRYLPKDQAPESSSTRTYTGDAQGANDYCGAKAGKGEKQGLSGHHPVFLVYPLIYFVTIFPVLVGQLVDSRGGNVGSAFHFTMGCLVAAQGFFNSILWTTTLFFLSRESITDIGFSAFTRTPSERRWGNLIWIQGGHDNGHGDSSNSNSSNHQDKKNKRLNRAGSGNVHEYEDRRTHRWWPSGSWLSTKTVKEHYPYRKDRTGKWPSVSNERTMSQETLTHIPGNPNNTGIQMETITTVVVENDR